MNKEGVFELDAFNFSEWWSKCKFLFERRDSFKRSLCHMINKILHIKTDLLSEEVC